MVKSWKTAALLVLAALLVTGCATRVTLTAQRTPTLDTVGIRRIAVMPFETAVRDRVSQAVAQHATAAAAAGIQATGHFELVGHRRVEQARRAGRDIGGYVDALFVGRIMRVGERTVERERRRTDRATGLTVTEVYFERTVQVEFNYYFERARDGTLIGPITRRGERVVFGDSRHDLPPAEDLAAGIVTAQLRFLYRDVAPYTVRISRPLAREPDRALRPLMNEALALVRAGNYVAARNAYIAIYETYGSVAAAENASILFEALGETLAGADFMQRVIVETGNPRAREVLARLDRELREQAGVVEFGDVRPPLERVTEFAVGEIRRVLSGNARVWIVGNSAGGNALVNDVVDTITSMFLRDGITVVDRQNADLVAAERRFQVAGHVRDDDFVSVGNAAGADTIVVVDVSGTGALRRLQVRVLDIERGVPVMQSDAGDAWRL